jgi:glycosyltransferase involved in cell wall biosynthesis
VARLTHQKNQSLLLRAYKASGVSEALVIVGSGSDEKKLRRLAAELGIADRVIFAGQQLNPYPWMKGARLFVLSSLYEGLGLVMVEAMACGTCVVAVDCPGGVRDVLIEEQARLIAEPTVDGLAAKIREGLAQPVAVREEWLRRFDAGQIARRFLQLA